MIPLSTTAIDVLRAPADSGYDEPYAGTSPATWTPVATNIPAVIDRPTGTLDLGGGQQNVADYRLICDPVDLAYTDQIYDRASKRTFKITWFIGYPEHVEAGIRDVEGEV